MEGVIYLYVHVFHATSSSSLCVKSNLLEAPKYVLNVQDERAALYSLVSLLITLFKVLSMPFPVTLCTQQEVFSFSLSYSSAFFDMLIAQV